MLLANPQWDEKECQTYGAVMTKESIFDYTNLLRSQDGASAITALIDSATTSQCPSSLKQFIIEGMMQMPLDKIADLYFNNMSMDWRTIIPRINLPTLIFSGRASSIPWQSQQWLHEQIKNSQLEIFEENEGGSHFLFLENPEKFNARVLEFIK